MIRSRQGLPIFTYHHVGPFPGDDLTVTPERFAEQVAYVATHCRSLFLDEVEACLKGDGTSSHGGATEGRHARHQIALTFDDGYADFWLYAFPLLRRHGVKATVFVNSGRVHDGALPRVDGTPVTRRHADIEDAPRPSDFLSWAEMAEMEGSGLVRIESHTHNHARCHSDLPDDRLRDELRRGKEEIERHLGKVCRYLAWPYGVYDQRATATARACGYQAAVTTFKGTNLTGDDPMHLRRISARNHSLLRFRYARWVFSSSALSGFYLSYKREPQPTVSHACE